MNQTHIEHTPTEGRAGGGAPPGPVALGAARTDAGNADRLALRAEGRILWVFGHGWLVWDGRRWGRDEVKAVTRTAIETARAIHAEAAALNLEASRATQDSEGERWAKAAKDTTSWAIQSEARARIDAMVALGAAQPRLALEGGAGALDAEPDALNVANGILDLTRFELRPHDPAAHHTKITGAEFMQGARSELWERFLESVIPSPEVRHWVQKAAGSALRGRYSEDLFIPWGSGKNGKSTFLRAIRNALGDYAMEAAPELLIRGRGKRSAGDNSAMADLRGRRFVTTIETGEGASLDEVFVKQLTGESVMKAKFMRQDWFEFENQSSIWLATNHKPRIHGADVAIWERLHLIPFDVFISPDRRDPELGAKLESPEHSAAILRWLVQGLADFDAEGLKPAPHEVADATATYREEMDPLAGWLESRVEVGDEETAPVAWVASSYRDYCRETGEPALSPRELNSSLEGRGFSRPGTARRSYGKPRKVWEGLRLANDWQFEWAEKHTTVVEDDLPADER
ncbi:MAG TPA: phage/plasmid primase, P4 family [Solirubrobacterales bacterium]|jgi:putative DNA primase/helicase|nr:phage/plasmid primase, P4 family [Solirubrobacterales bacterium]